MNREQFGETVYDDDRLEPKESVILGDTMQELLSFISAIDNAIRDSSATEEEKREMLKRVGYLRNQLEALRF